MNTTYLTQVQRNAELEELRRAEGKRTQALVFELLKKELDAVIASFDGGMLFSNQQMLTRVDTLAQEKLQAWMELPIAQKAGLTTAQYDFRITTVLEHDTIRFHYSRDFQRLACGDFPIYIDGVV